jgi:hypothetical protein
MCKSILKETVVSKETEKLVAAKFEDMVFELVDKGRAHPYFLAKAKEDGCLLIHRGMYDDEVFDPNSGKKVLSVKIPNNMFIPLDMPRPASYVYDLFQIAQIGCILGCTVSFYFQGYGTAIIAPDSDLVLIERELEKHSGNGVVGPYPEA